MFENFTTLTYLIGANFTAKHCYMSNKAHIISQQSGENVEELWKIHPTIILLQWAIYDLRYYVTI